MGRPVTNEELLLEPPQEYPVTEEMLLAAADQFEQQGVDVFDLVANLETNVDAPSVEQ